MLVTSIAGGGHEGESLGELIIHHVSDSPPLLPLRIGSLDVSITKHVLMLMVSGVIVLTMFLWYSRHVRKVEDGVPMGRLANMVDFFVEYIYKQMTLPLIGEKYAARWTPLIAAYFFFILVCNLLGLTPLFDWIPGSSTATGNYNVTAGLALVTFTSVIFAGTMAHGFIGHWKNMVPP